MLKFSSAAVCASLAVTGTGYGAGNFVKTQLDNSPDKPAFVKVTDLDGDSKPEIIVSMFGKSPVGSGSVYIYSGGNDGLDSWEKKKLEGSDTRFPNSVTVDDVNGDGTKDIILPGGFLACTGFPMGYCGSMQWFAQNSDGSFTNHLLLEKQKRFYHHVELVDFDGDGFKDIVAVGEEKGLRGDGSSELQIFAGNNSKMAFSGKPKTIAKGLGSFPSVRDFDQDGEWEVFSSEYFGSKGSFSWLDKKANGQWQRHYIDNSVGKTIQLSFVDNLYGNGQTWAIGANHTNTTDDASAPESAVYVYKVPKFTSDDFNPDAAWEKTKISEGIVSRKSPMMGPQGAPGVFAYGDVDGDGDIDVVVSGDGDPRIFFLRQDGEGVFKTVVVDDNMPQGGVAVADLNGDGKAEIIASSYEANQLNIYQFQK